MTKRIVLSFFAAMSVLTFGSTAREARAAAGKVDVCHVPPGNPAGAMTISVGSQAALNAHLAHGDTQGACNSLPSCQEACWWLDPVIQCAPDDVQCLIDVPRLFALCLAGQFEGQPCTP